MTSARQVIILAIIWTSIDIFHQGHTEIMKTKVSVTRLVDGKVSASICVGNLSSTTMLNRSIDFYLNTTLDDSQNLVGAHGMVIDKNVNQTVDLSNIKEKDEEIKNLQNILNFFCPKGGYSPLVSYYQPLINPSGEDKLNASKYNWEPGDRKIPERRTQQADLLIVDSTQYIYSGEIYREKMLEITKRPFWYSQPLKCNFLITEDGNVFEDLGFDHFDFSANGGLGPRSLIIAFIKSKKHDAPSKKAIGAFNELVKIAICSKKLSTAYRLIPYYLIDDFFRLSDRSFERNQMRDWERYQNDLEFLIPSQKEEKFLLRIVPYSGWSEEVVENAIDYSGPVEYVVIMQYGPRCFLNCTTIVRNSFDKLNILYRGANFMITEDSWVYEVYGWGKTNKDWAKEKKAVVIALAGTFHSYGPNTIVFSALKALIQEGLSKGYLSTKYKVVSLKEFVPHSLFLHGLFLENVVKNLDFSNIN